MLKFRYTFQLRKEPASNGVKNYKFKKFFLQFHKDNFLTVKTNITKQTIYFTSEYLFEINFE